MVGTPADGFALFDTALGTCALAWNERALTGVQLPEDTVDGLRVRALDLHPGAVESPPPAHARSAAEAIAELVDAGERDLVDIPLDMGDVAAFARDVYETARRIPPGSTSTYGEIAAEIGRPGSARAVGRALGANPFAIVVPCHRVLAAGGRTGGFSAGGGVTTKMWLLAREQAVLGLW
ncbi:methylated-DNA--[protein]-cysteine S-methyltransferase [Tsukamurella sp. 8F]|uniref:methylated-DNA--[protein]-cysteine S-methyltransferase n=1 Tax=unclassified Tsukamurella TaxID=2633480 RepID=UPI0023BA3D09|nr:MULTISPECIES: methylated-DNA--[protein]-cysteine S-methyltransferase [unclassified Tsukamurella]MDF0532069.1 methylated-DNA--[protein]-cysteine S-methyltransferase [Tsukamurella sp. 8J]MDF0589181.1 methylated-DNA--[protein]-cysteine S-methyltransferase [Tsukamurella sp. 8F]